MGQAHGQAGGKGHAIDVNVADTVRQLKAKICMKEGTANIIF